MPEKGGQCAKSPAQRRKSPAQRGGQAAQHMGNLACQPMRRALGKHL